SRSACPRSPAASCNASRSASSARAAARCRSSSRLLAVPRRVGLVLLSLVAGLVLLEIGLRVIAHATSRERALVFDPDLGWRMTPGASKLGKYWGSTRPATTNARSEERRVGKECRS